MKIIISNYDDPGNPYYAEGGTKINPMTNVKIIFAGADSKYFKMKTKEENYVLHLGIIDVFHKGLDTLIKAWEKISSKLKELSFI